MVTEHEDIKQKTDERVRLDYYTWWMRDEMNDETRGDRPPPCRVVGSAEPQLGLHTQDGAAHVGEHVGHREGAHLLDSLVQGFSTYVHLTALVRSFFCDCSTIEYPVHDGGVVHSTRLDSTRLGYPLDVRGGASSRREEKSG